MGEKPSSSTASSCAGASAAAGGARGRKKSLRVSCLGDLGDERCGMRSSGGPNTLGCPVVGLLRFRGQPGRRCSAAAAAVVVAAASSFSALRSEAVGGRAATQPCCQCADVLGTATIGLSAGHSPDSAGAPGAAAIGLSGGGDRCPDVAVACKVTPHFLGRHCWTTASESFTHLPSVCCVLRTDFFLIFSSSCSFSIS